jgi:hypothetical protein
MQAAVAMLTAAGNRSVHCHVAGSTGLAPSIQPWSAPDHMASCSMLNQISNRPRVADDTGAVKRHVAPSSSRPPSDSPSQHQVRRRAVLSSINQCLCCLRCFVDASIALNKSHCCPPLCVVDASQSSRRRARRRIIKTTVPMCVDDAGASIAPLCRRRRARLRTRCRYIRFAVAPSGP